MVGSSLQLTESKEPECWAVGDFLWRAPLPGCREARAWVSTNLFVRDLDLPVAPHDARQLEVVRGWLGGGGGPRWPSPSMCRLGTPRSVHQPCISSLFGASDPDLFGSQGRGRLVLVAVDGWRSPGPS